MFPLKARKGRASKKICCTDVRTGTGVAGLLFLLAAAGWAVWAGYAMAGGNYCRGGKCKEYPR